MACYLVTASTDLTTKGRRLRSWHLRATTVAALPTWGELGEPASGLSLRQQQVEPTAPVATACLRNLPPAGDGWR
jgi:hypothetical protein